MQRICKYVENKSEMFVLNINGYLYLLKYCSYCKLPQKNISNMDTKTDTLYPP